MQDEVTVTQADREAAYGAYFECYDTAPNDLWLQAMLEGRHDEDSLIQVLARHRHQAERDVIARMEPVGWRPIETAPKDGTPFLAAIWVGHNDEPRRWDMHVIGYDAAYDEMNSDFETGWEIEDYAFWQPLPTPPAGEA